MNVDESCDDFCVDVIAETEISVQGKIGRLCVLYKSSLFDSPYPKIVSGCERLPLSGFRGDLVGWLFDYES